MANAQCCKRCGVELHIVRYGFLKLFKSILHRVPEIHILIVATARTENVQIVGDTSGYDTLSGYCAGRRIWSA